MRRFVYSHLPTRYESIIWAVVVIFGFGFGLAIVGTILIGLTPGWVVNLGAVMVAVGFMTAIFGPLLLTKASYKKSSQTLEQMLADIDQSKLED